MSQLPPLLNRLLSHQIVHAPSFLSAKDNRVDKSVDKVEKKDSKSDELKKQEVEYKELKSFYKAARKYDKSLAKLSKYPLAHMQAIEGINPEYGRYETVPNSGWIASPASSLSQFDALTPTDKINYGQHDAQGNSLLSQIGPAETWQRVVKEQDADGRHPDRRERHINDYIKQMLAQLQHYDAMDGLEHRNDPLSLLVKTQLKDIYGRLEYLTDDKKLQALTGIDMYDQTARKKLFYDRLLPNPLDHPDESVTLHTKPEHEIASSLDPEKSKTWNYLSKNLLATPYKNYRDEQGKETIDPEDLMHPYQGLSDLAKSTLATHRQRMTDLIARHPQLMNSRLRDDYFNREDLWGAGNSYINPPQYDPMKFSSSSYDFIKKHLGTDRVGESHYYKALKRSEPFSVSDLPTPSRLGADVDYEKMAKKIMGCS